MNVCFRSGDKIFFCHVCLVKADKGEEEENSASLKVLSSLGSTLFQERLEVQEWSGGRSLSATCSQVQKLPMQFEQLRLEMPRG